MSLASDEQPWLGAFHYEVKLIGDGEVSLIQRPCEGVTKVLLGYHAPTGTEVELRYTTDPQWSEDIDPHRVDLEISFTDTGEYPDRYYGTVTAHLSRGQLKRLRDGAAFLLTQMKGDDA